jgi:hypothetical protein
MMTFVSPAAAGALLVAGAALDDTALNPALEGPDALLSLEHPATHATMVAALAAISNSRFTKFSFW